MNNSYHEKLSTLLTLIINQLPDNQAKEDIIVLFEDFKNTEASDTPSKKFIPPTLKDVENYLVLQNVLNPVENAERFINFYEAKGWMIGKNKMKSWQSAVKSWNMPVRHSKKTKIIV
jgi:hypothetical protein